MKPALNIIVFFFLFGLAATAQDISIETLPAVVVQTHPQSGDTCVDAGISELLITYSKEMFPHGWSMVELSGDSFPEIVGQPKYKKKERTFRVKVKLEPGKTYAMALNTDKYKNFRDRDEIPALPYLLIFKTKEE